MSDLNQRSNPELKSLFEIAILPLKEKLQDYFLDVMGKLSSYFPIQYSALLIHDIKNDFLRLEATYGVEKKSHPSCCGLKDGVIGKAIDARKPMLIQNLSQEPFYEEMAKKKSIIEKIYPPLLCMPLISEERPIGIMTINSFINACEEFSSDFQFLMVLNNLLLPRIERYIKNESSKASIKSRSNSYFLDEILEEKLNDLLNKVDPYVEVKGKMSLLNDVVSLVEKILIQAALKKVDYVQTTASELLGINRNTLRKKVKDLKIKIP